jgi:hypothetical protein
VVSARPHAHGSDGVSDDAVGPARSWLIKFPRLGSASTLLGTVLFVLVCVLLVDAVLEGWLVNLLGSRHQDATGATVVEAAGWPKNVKSALYITTALATAAKFTIDRTWGRLRTRADVALLVLAAVLLLAGIFGPSSPKLIVQAMFVYFRGAILFYALRAMNPGPTRIRKIVWLLGGLMGLEVLVALAQFVFGQSAFQAVGWVDMGWARIGRAQALLEHPNDLGHFAGLMLLGLFALFAVRASVGRWWWVAAAGTALALGAAQSRESIVAVLLGLVVIFLLRWAHWRRFAALAGLVILTAAIPIATSQTSRDEWIRRFAGVAAALHIHAGDECAALGITNAANPDESCKGADREIRLLYYQQGEKLLVRRPVLGYGIGQFGGIVAYQDDPNWNLDPRFQPVGFDKYNFAAKTVDAFWLHLVIEAGVVGLIAYLAWQWFLAAPFVRELRPRRGEPRRTRAPGHPALYWAPAAILFVTIVATLSAALEDPLVPPLLFTIVGIGWVVLARNRAGDATGVDGRPGGSRADGLRMEQQG